MATFQVIQQRPVMQEQRIGSIPKDAYVQNRGFAPNVAPAVERAPGDTFEVVDGQEVKAFVPARNADGTLQIVKEEVALEATPYSPVKFGLAGAGIAGAAGAAAGAALAGLPGALAGGLVSALAGGGIGAQIARDDEVSVVTRQAAVSTPVLTGYTTGSVDGAFVSQKPGHWFTDSGGRFHYALPQIEHRPVGEVQIHEVQHSSSRSPLEMAGAAAGLGLAAGGGIALALIAFVL